MASVFLNVIAGLLISAFLWLLIWLSPESASRCGQELANGILFPIAFCVISAIAFRLYGENYPAFSLTFAIAGFFLPLFWLWFSGTSETMLIGGILPFSDAAGYFGDARLLASGSHLQGMGNEHPLATAMLAVLWKATYSHYRITLALIMAFGALASWLAMAEVSVLLGAGAAVTWLLVNYLFLRRFIGIPVAEHVGLIFGNLGVAFSCRAIRSGCLFDWPLAMFSLTLAVCARPGAILTLPALLCGAYMAWPRKERAQWELPAAMALVMATALFLNYVVKMTVGDSRNGAMGNAVFVLHSIVYGGTWKDAMNRYGFDNLAVWNAVTKQLHAHPFSLFRGAGRSLFEFTRQFYLFSFVNRRWLNITFHVFFAIGVISAFIAMRINKRAYWIVAFVAGLILSIPYLPPWDTDGMRAYAASIPLIGLTVALGVYYAISSCKTSKLTKFLISSEAIESSPLRTRFEETSYLGILSISLLTLMLILSVLLPPFLLKSTCPSGPAIEVAYAEGGTRANLEYLSYTALNITTDKALPGIDSLRQSDFRAGLSAFEGLYPAEASLLRRIPSDCSLLPIGADGMLVAVDKSHLPSRGGDQAIDLRFRFIADGWLLIAADEAVVTRSADLAAYCPEKIGQFYFGIDQYPVIRVGDSVTFAKKIQSVSRVELDRGMPSVNPAYPLVLDIHRMRFPLAGEYYLKLNQKYPLKLLVLERNISRAEAALLIRHFVEANCIAEPNDGSNSDKVIPNAALKLWFEADEPIRMSSSSIRKIIDLLESNFGAQGSF